MYRGSHLFDIWYQERPERPVAAQFRRQHSSASASTIGPHGSCGIRNHGCSGNAVVITRRFPISWNLTKVENKGEPSSHVPSISPFVEYIFFLGHSISPTLLKSQAQTQTTLCVLYPDSSILLVQQIIQFLLSDICPTSGRAEQSALQLIKRFSVAIDRAVVGG